MIMKGFSIYDSKVEAFMPLFFCRSVGEAMRSLEDAISDPKHQFSRHVEDYTLFHICDYDDQAGHVTPVGKSVARLVEIRAPLNLGE